MSEPKRTIDAPGAPAAIGPYSHAVAAGGLLFCSGQIPLDPETGEVAAFTPGEQTTQCLRNLQAVCDAGGTSLEQAVRLTIYTTEMALFEEINEAYSAFFPSDPPARAVVGVADLPKGVAVEVDAVVAL